MEAKSLVGRKALVDKAAVITGAASGIGKASVPHFVQEGATCVAADLNYDSLLKLQERTALLSWFQTKEPS